MNKLKGVLPIIAFVFAAFAAFAFSSPAAPDAFQFIMRLYPAVTAYYPVISLGSS